MRTRTLARPSDPTASHDRQRHGKLELDSLGLLLVGAGGAAITALPFLVVKPNRIASGVPKSLLEAIPGTVALGICAVLILCAGVAVLVKRPGWRSAAAFGGLLVVAVAVGWAAAQHVPAGNSFVRVSPGSGAWLLLLALSLLATDGQARLNPGPLARVAGLFAALAMLLLALRTGLFDELSVMREYAVRTEIFWREARQHMLLAMGSMGAAVAAGVPLGILCARISGLRGPTLQILNLIQTVPSIALFGILMVPLSVLAKSVPLAGAIGIRGIGAAPALVALFLYSLLPIVANTVAGLRQVPDAILEAARGMGMTARQVRWRIALPLALPVILTGIRIVLVQNIGARHHRSPHRRRRLWDVRLPGNWTDGPRSRSARRGTDSCPRLFRGCDP